MRVLFLLSAFPNHISHHSQSLALNLPPSTSNPKLILPTAFHFLAGLSTGTLSAFLLQPADLLKTRLQQSPTTALLPTLRSITSSPHPLRLLWRGTLPSVIRTGLGSALYFSTLNALRQHVARSNLLVPPNIPLLSPATTSQPSTLPTQPSSSSALPRLSNIANLTTGAIARAGAGFLMTPITVLKVRYESSLYAYPSLSSATRHILRTAGPRGFFAGFGATAIRDAPYAGLYVLFYEEAKRRLSTLYTITPTLLPNGAAASAKEMGTTRAAPINFLSGVVAAVLATTITNPFDAVKTRIQLMPERYGNMAVAGVRMVREEGVRSLFGGLGLRMGRKAVSSALAWTLYEELIKRAEGRWREGEKVVV
ncbi:hypothetical protein MMC30_000958 [Trapelia coarctata]|nr:hypothetical protein [Trapelia coarctata]